MNTLCFPLFFVVEIQMGNLPFEASALFFICLFCEIKMCIPVSSVTSTHMSVPEIIGPVPGKCVRVCAEEGRV